MDAEPQLYCQYRNGLRDIFARKLAQLPKNVPKVYWFYGKAGTGKTREAERIGVEEYDNSVWRSGDQLKWFDGYANHRLAIFDDFRKEKCTFSYLLRLLDRYEL